MRFEDTGMKESDMVSPPRSVRERNLQKLAVRPDDCQCKHQISKRKQSLVYRQPKKGVRCPGCEPDNHARGNGTDHPSEVLFQVQASVALAVNVQLGNS